MTTLDAPPEIRRVPVAPDVALAVRVWPGDGVPFVLVHGLASNARLWDTVAAHLASLGHAVVAVDQRGHGLSDKPDGGYDFTTVTDDLAALLEALRIERPVLAGQSWGGNVVLEFAWRFPRAVRGIACVDGGTIELGGRFESWEAARAALTPPPLVGRRADEIETMLRRMHPDWPESGITGTMANFELRADGTVAPWLTLDRHLLIVRSLWEHRPSTRYPEVSVPVMLIVADAGDDQMAAAKRAGVAGAEASIPRVRTHWMHGDHDLHAQHPVALADLLHGAVTDGFFA